MELSLAQDHINRAPIYKKNIFIHDKSQCLIKSKRMFNDNFVADITKKVGGDKETKIDYKMR